MRNSVKQIHNRVHGEKKDDGNRQRFRSTITGFASIQSPRVGIIISAITRRPDSVSGGGSGGDGDRVEKIHIMQGVST